MMKLLTMRTIVILFATFTICCALNISNIQAEAAYESSETVESTVDEASDLTETSISASESDEKESANITDESTKIAESSENESSVSAKDTRKVNVENDIEGSNLEAPRQDGKFFNQSLVVTTDYGATITDDTTVPSNTDLVYKFHYEHIPGTPAQKLKFDFRQKGLALKSYMVSMTGMPTVIRKASGEHTSYESYQTLDDTHHQMDIEVHGYVQRVKKRIKIPAGSASMSWNTGFLLPNWHYREGPGLPRFTILPIGDIHMKVKETTINTLPHESVHIEGFLAHDNSLKCQDVEVVLRRQDGSQVIATRDDEDRFKITLEPRDLELGSNQLTLYAHCKGVYGSFPIEVNIEVKDGELKLADVSKTMAFNNTTLSGEAQEVQRQGDVQVEVQDTRHELKTWQVTVANTDGLKDEHGDSLKGQIVYKKAGTPQKITKNPVVIATHKLERSTNEKYDVSEDWKNDSGILLEVAPDAAAGKYQGTLTWTLSDAPNGQ